MIRKNIFIYTHKFFLNIFSKRNECIFEIEYFILLLFKYFEFL